MRRWLWACTCAILGCFGEGDTDVDVDESGSSGAATSVGASTDASSATSTSAGTGSASGSTSVGPDTDTGATTTDADSSDATSSSVDESSSTGEASTWCDAQPSNVLVCYDFDGEVPFLAGTVRENDGTVDASDEQAVSAPRSMRAEIMPSMENAEATLARTIAGATLPFDGVLAMRVWVDPVCHEELGGTIERFMLALQFSDAGGNLLNITYWFNAQHLTVYESDNPMGFPSTPHQLDIAIPTGTWVDVSLAYDASGDVVTFAAGGSEQAVQLVLATQEVRAAIADVTPGTLIGGVMGPNVPGCTIYFDDFTVSE